MDPCLAAEINRITLSTRPDVQKSPDFHEKKCPLLEKTNTVLPIFCGLISYFSYNDNKFSFDNLKMAKE